MTGVGNEYFSGTGEGGTSKCCDGGSCCGGGGGGVINFPFSGAMSIFSNDMVRSSIESFCRSCGTTTVPVFSLTGEITGEIAVTWLSGDGNLSASATSICVAVPG